MHAKPLIKGSFYYMKSTKRKCWSVYYTMGGSIFTQNRFQSYTIQEHLVFTDLPQNDEFAIFYRVFNGHIISVFFR